MRTRVLIGALASMSLGACATAGAPAHGSSQDAYEARYNADYDAAKVATVEQWAHAHHATIIWVNYPRKKPEGT